MAELTVNVVKIDHVLEHPNADRMELAMVGGYQVCIQKGGFKKGDLGVYIPVDSVLTPALEAVIFGPDSKVKLKNHRVRAIKLRGAVSQGMLIPLEIAAGYIALNKPVSKPIVEGTDVTEALGITKYQPPVKVPNAMRGRQAPKRHCHPNFSKYTDVDHLKKYWNAFEDDEPVIGTEKLHGTNFRCGWVPFVPRTFVQKLKNIFRLNPKWEFVYGSHNVQLMDGGSKARDAFAGNVYKRIVETHSLRTKVEKGQLWYGEIIGPGIQTNYEYGLDEVDVYFMDIKDSVTQEYLSFGVACAFIEGEDEKMPQATQ
jgi:RNA ligase (TIGR02306 family)